MGDEAAALALEAAMPEEERVLWQAVHLADGRVAAQAREALFSRFQPVARRIAWRFMRDDPATPMEFAELLQLASVGLLEAIDRYQPDRGVPFRFYCTRRIAGSIAEGIAGLSEVNRQISTRRRLERERLRSVRADSAAPKSLDDKLSLIGDIAAELAIGLMLEDSVMFVTDERDPARDAYETLAWKQAVDQVVGALEALPEREQRVIRHHYIEGLPFDHLARMMGLSKGRISQIHKAALGLLRKRLSGKGHFRLRS
ncbi:MAG: sigma-70 family RNA polymerase sigma factor [Sphingomonadales bacterium]|nr:sigma-70 family RNA polymerase sigma factor [Sphingomonadales bacterium]